MTFGGWGAACYDDWVTITLDAALDISTDQIRLQALIRSFDCDVGYPNPIWRTKWFPKDTTRVWVVESAHASTPPPAGSWYGRSLGRTHRLLQNPS